MVSDDEAVVRRRNHHHDDVYAGQPDGPDGHLEAVREGLGDDGTMVDKDAASGGGGDGGVVSSGGFDAAARAANHGIGLMSSVALIYNNITGPALAELPVIFQRAGYLSTLLCIGFTYFLCHMASHMMVEIMACMPGNDKYQAQAEYSTCLKHYFGERSKTFKICHVFLFCYLQSVNVAMIVQSSQMFDMLTVYLFGRSCGLEIVPPGIVCANEKHNTSPFGNNCILSVGFGLTGVLALPMAYWKLEENKGVQVGSFILILVTVLFWSIGFIFHDADTGRVPAIGKDQSEVVGTILFSYAMVTTVPSWLNEKKPNVDVRVVVSQSLGWARKEAHDTRVKRLMPELQQRNRKGGFEDSRLGQGDESLTTEEKASLRFQRERQNRAKMRDAYNLNDKQDILTHKGKSLDLDAEMSDKSDDDDINGGYLDAATVEAAHFGGGGPPATTDANGENRPKSRQEIYDEVVAKSKAYRQERHKQRAEQEENIAKLDETFKEIRPLFQASGLMGGQKKKPKMDEYDKLTREMGFDRTARPSHLEMTSEQMYAREVQRLELLERERLRRMEGGGSDQEDGDEGENDGKGKDTESAEALEENFVLDDKFMTGGDMEDDEEEDHDDDDDDDDDDEESESEDDEDEDESESEEGDDDDNDTDKLGDGMESKSKRELLDLASDSDSEAEVPADDDEEDEDNDDSDEGETLGSLSRVPKRPQDTTTTETKGGVAAASESVGDEDEEKYKQLPYMYTLPTTAEEFWKLIEPHEQDKGETEVVLTRLFASNHVKAKESLEGDMQRLLTSLVKDFLSVCLEQPVSWRRVDIISSAIFQAAVQVPEHATAVFCDEVETLRGAAVRAAQRGRDFRWPSVPQLCLIRLVAHVFPITDARHKVVTPTVLHLAQCLTHAPIKVGRHVLISLFVCNIFLQFMYRSKRLVPEVFACLGRLLPTADQPQTPLTLSQDAVSDVPSRPSNLSLGLLYNHPDNLAHLSSDSFRVDALAMAYRILIGYTSPLKNHSALPDLYAFVSNHLAHTSTTSPPALEALRTSLAEKLAAHAEQAQRTRVPLSLHRRRAMPMRLLNPSFKEDVDFDRRYAGHRDSDKAQQKKMKRILKQETRGAVRELLKDNAFLAQEREKRVAANDAEREEKGRRAMAWLQEEAAKGKQQDKDYRNIKRKMKNK